MAVGVEVEVISRRRSAPNQRVVTNPIITLAAMIAMVIRAWGLMQGMAAIMAVALKYVCYLLKLISNYYSLEDSDRCEIKASS